MCPRTCEMLTHGDEDASALQALDLALSGLSPGRWTRCYLILAAARWQLVRHCFHFKKEKPKPKASAICPADTADSHSRASEPHSPAPGALSLGLVWERTALGMRQVSWGFCLKTGAFPSSSSSSSCHHFTRKPQQERAFSCVWFYILGLCSLPRGLA